MKENPFPLKSFHIDELKIGNKIIAKLSGVDNRTQAELLLPFQIYFPRSEFPKLKSTNEYYIQDLIGLNVIDFHQGNIVGKVHGHYFNGAQTILTLTDLNGEDIDLLFLEQFVPEVNISEGYLKAVLPFYVDQN